MKNNTKTNANSHIHGHGQIYTHYISTPFSITIALFNNTQISKPSFVCVCTCVRGPRTLAIAQTSHNKRAYIGSRADLHTLNKLTVNVFFELSSMFLCSCVRVSFYCFASCLVPLFVCLPNVRGSLLPSFRRSTPPFSYRSSTEASE